MDRRSKIEKFMWEKIGPPLYYCADCLRGVKVTAVEGVEPIVTRRCGPECGPQIIAPRSAVCVGKGGASVPTRVKVAALQAAAAITGRNV